MWALKKQKVPVEKADLTLLNFTPVVLDFFRVTVHFCIIKGDQLGNQRASFHWGI